MSRREQVLSLLAQHKISIDEAMAELAALDEAEAAAHPTDSAATVQTPRHGERAKFLRVIVQVKGSEEGEKGDADIDMCLPLALARVIGPLVGLIPPEAQARIREHGLDLSTLDINAFIDGLEGSDVREIVSLQVNDAEKDRFVKVNIHAE